MELESAYTTEILRQLGGNRFLAMIGASRVDCLGLKTLAVRFKARAKNGVNFLQVTLDADDTYTVRFMRQNGRLVMQKAAYSQIYWEDLPGLFESETGLYTKL